MQTPDLGGVPSEEDPFPDCFTGVDNAADLNDAYTLFEEAHRLFSRAFTNFRADLSQCEAELQKTSDERNAFKLLYSQKEEELRDLQTDLAKARKDEAELEKQVTIILKEFGLLDPTVEANTSMYRLQQKLDRIELLRREVNQVKADYNRQKENMDRLAAEKEAALSKQASAEAQLRGAKENSSALAKRIDKLEVKLVEAMAEVDKTKVTADKTIAVYLRDAEATQTQLREASDRERLCNDLARCQSRRETLE
ncbi:PREDICTED: uncharacterized protein LOC109210475 isoform X1 [Nicotiana attenuata]|uniref:uncharacterized protein LOC109210475 isoform X1 n=1 Tax=Nicotiana attenuata TaxID=49451 RepID=UPI0009050440|nr:PREDICTED: uncharacterized protein LOC109210475 isoform X1 [Nicotiana attenuata]